MGKTACVFIFSGTGMTDYVVSKIKNAAEKTALLIDIHEIENPDTRDVQIQDYDIIGIAYPVHSFNAPKIVIDFAKQLPKANGINTFIINTAGDESWLNRASSNLLMRILSSKNYDVFYNKQFIMPSNFIVKNDDEVVTQRLEAVCREAMPTATAIYECISYNEKPNIFARALSVIARLEWIGAKRMSEVFYSDELCVGCERCVRLCPNNNIVASENKITFKQNCGLCMRCIYTCPQNAIKIRGIFKFFSIGTWYTNEELRYKK